MSKPNAIWNIITSLLPFLRKKEQNEPETTITVKAPIDEPLPLFDYSLLRVWTFRDSMSHHTQENLRRTHEVWKLLQSELPQHTRVIIVHSPLDRPQNSARLLKDELEKNDVEVTCILSAHEISLDERNKCTDENLRRSIKDIVQEHYVIFISHTHNIRYYAELEHVIKGFDPREGEGITSKGKVINFQWTNYPPGCISWGISFSIIDLTTQLDTISPFKYSHDKKWLRNHPHQLW